MDIEALKSERSLCARRGLKDRVAAIDAELKRLGATAATSAPEVEVAAVAAPETAARPRANRRTATA